MSNLAVCLMGPTAAGKTEVAVALRERFPIDIISVDSALVYRHMDIGTAKPDAATLAAAPHQLIDIRDPEQQYSAGEFVRDAERAIATSFAAGRVPLLAGGTMMYFRALTEGIASLPQSDPELRAQLDAEAAAAGWPALHQRLQRVDPEAAARIKPTDSQRIQRALEVYSLSGRPLSEWHRRSRSRRADAGVQFLKVALDVPDRAQLHARIEQRLNLMFKQGFVDEVAALQQRPGLHADLPSMRAVGYRQVWAHLAGATTLEECRYRALVATRQLAKRQFTWLRSEADLFSVSALEADRVDAISNYLVKNHPILV